MKNLPRPSTGTIGRRQFLKGSVAALSAAGLAGTSWNDRAEETRSQSPARIASHDVILFQGDSITDFGRSRKDADKPNNQPAMGHGYAWMIGSALLVDRPHDGLKIFNRGVSGNKVFQLADRWDADCLALKPNLLSILIGVNDYWHTYTGYHGTVQIYERDYRALLDRTRRALPEVKLVICEPFALRCGAVKDSWFPAFDAYRTAAKRVAESFQALFIPLQSMFDTAVQFAPPEHWAHDGVHPSDFGAALMAHEWLRRVAGS